MVERFRIFQYLGTSVQDDERGVVLQMDRQG